jgi:hypothetical protein
MQAGSARAILVCDQKVLVSQHAATPLKCPDRPKF